MLLAIKNFVTQYISTRGRKIIQKYISPLASYFFRNDLTALALMNGTDKYGSHWYTPHYQKHFERYRHKKINILEIGVGGYADPRAGGGSVRMWKHFFPHGMIYAIDIHDKKLLEEKRIRIFQGDQTDTDFLKRVVGEMGGVDIIIDDGSHINDHVIATFNVLFPLLNTGGIYAVEDLQTAYWPNYGGNSDNPRDNKTSINYFKGLVDCLNHQEFLRPDYEPTYFDKNIIAVYFYHNLVFIYKGDNSEQSNLVAHGRFKK